MKLCFIFGTRPEIIKISPVIKECQKRKIDFVLIHTNQHYAKNLDEVFFQCLDLPRAKYNLGVGSGRHGEITGRMIIELETRLLREEPDMVLVQGDTNSVLAGALAAVKLNIPVGHIEAGLRSFDRLMPEEINRTIVDHIADYLFAPTAGAQENLLKEGIAKKQIFITGNTVVGALLSHIAIAKKKSKILSRLDLSAKEYILSTVHRQENVDDIGRLKGIFNGLQKAAEKLGRSVVIPAHPRLIKMLRRFKIPVSQKIKLIEPVDYLDFINLEKNAQLVITDSGGVQEEACILKTACVTVRDNTERPETIFVGSNILAGAGAEKISLAADKMSRKKTGWSNPFGSSLASAKIIDIICKKIK